MDRTRIVAALALFAVVALVVGLAVTRDDETPADAGAEALDDGASTLPDVATTAPAPASPRGPETVPTEPVVSDAVVTVPVVTERVVSDLPDRGPHPPLLDIDGWLQSDITSLEELRGRVVAVQFWTFGCSNCRATLPHLRSLYDDLGGDDFEVVGVHAPEFDHEADPDAIAAAAADLGVTWPIALDTEKRTFRSWQGDRRFWPRIYLLDRDGHIRYDHIGEGAYDEIRAHVEELIAEP